MPMDFRVCNALKIKPFQALLRNTPFCSLGEVGGGGQGCKILFPVFGGEMATAKIQTVKGLRVEIFSRPLRKNTTRPLTVWIVGTDIERGLFFVIRYGIIFPSTNR